MNGEIKLALPPNLNDDLKQLWLSAAGDAIEQVARSQKTPDYMNQTEAARYMAVSVTTFKKFVSRGLPVIEVGGIVRYSKAAIDEWYKNQTI